MKGYWFFILMLAFSFNACSDAGNTNDTAMNTSEEREKIKNSVLKFYIWYAENEEKMHQFKLFKGQTENENPPFVINWQEVDRYFAYLRKNVPHVNEKFIEWEKKHFAASDSLFKLHPEDEIPIGFDYDRITLSQEDPKWLLDELNKKDNRWEINIKGSLATVVVYSKEKVVTDKSDSFSIICLKLRKEKEEWKIEKIGCEFVEDQYLP